MNQENYNETVLIPVFEKKVHALTSAVILAEARLEIAFKQIAELQKQLDAAQAAAKPVEAPAVTEDGA
jgi:predicted protein tyrosine phosphatase